MLRSSWLLSAAILVSCAGCAEAPVEHTVRKVTADVKTRLTSSLEAMDAEIAKLREKGLALKDEAKTRWNEKMADLQAKQEAARKKLDELGTSTGEAWERLEKGAQSAWDELQKALQEAAKEF
jgi:Skp family chaperone for outer membrane proteins